MHTDVNRILIDHNDFIRGMIRRRCAGHGISAADVEDIEGDIILHLASKALKYYRPSRGPVKPFIFRCIDQAMADQYKSRNMRRRLHPRAMAPELLDADDRNSKALEPAIDRRIERLARLIIADPEGMGFNAKQGRLISALVDHGSGLHLAQISTRLGYRHSSTVSRLRRQIRQRLQAMLESDLGASA